MRRTFTAVSLSAALLGAQAFAQEYETEFKDAAETPPADSSVVGQTPKETPKPIDAPKAVTPPADLPPPSNEPATVTTAQETKFNELRAGDLTASVKLNARVSGQMDSAFPVDTQGTVVSPNPVDTRFRIAPEVQMSGFGLAAEADVYSGAYGGLPNDDVGYGATPYATRSPTHFRQAYVQYKGETWVMRLGEQTSHWGLGLLANSGAFDAQPGDFGDARLGDLTYRALIAGRPFFSFGGAWRAIEPAIAFDVINRDDFADFSRGDRALQGVAALRFAVDNNRQLGVYAVYRRQRAVGEDPELRATDAVILDFAGKWEWKRGPFTRSLGFETAYITGTTTQARNDLFPRQQVGQFGAAFKGSYGYKNFTTYLDYGFASGDQNPYDDKVQNFRFDPDYNAGFILYDQVLATMSARTSAHASDPNIVGTPQDGVDLLPTRGAITGSTYVFPRARYGVTDWLDVYGGPLFAWTTARWVDPFSARTQGGASLNTLGGRSGNFLGSELDVGAQARWKPATGLTVSATVEGGAFLPGDAFATQNGDVMGPVASGRLRLGINL